MSKNDPDETSAAPGTDAAPRADASRLIANLTHELKTPLHSILALASVLSSEVDGALSAEQRRQVEMIQRNGERLLEMITELLQYTAITTETRSLRLRRVAVRRLFEQLVLTLTPVAAQSGVRIEADLSRLASHAISDESLLNRIFGNLLSNAVKFSPNGGTVSLFAETAKDDGLRAQVADSGIGIPLEVQRSIFEEFYQADTGDSRRFGGVGLGLSLVKSSVSRLRGRLEVKSEPGRGSLFTVELPSLAGEWQRPKILIVDEDPTIRLTLSECFAAEGFESSVVAGDEVVREIGSRAPDLVLLDLAPENLGGFRVLSEIRSSQWGKALPVILISTVDTPRERARAFELGANDFLVKPFDVAELLARVKGQLERGW